MDMDAQDLKPDAIVIGSGIGGLTAAGLLAGVAGRRVLVLEQHTEPGGFTHAFRRDGASWDVGLHYVGQLDPGAPARAYFDYLSGGALQWNRMPDEFEHFHYPGLHMAVPSDPQRYRDRLAQRFPEEAGAIDRYFRAVRRAAAWSTLGLSRAMVPRPFAPLLRLAERLSGGTATQPTARVLERLVRSPQLRALLTTQWLDYGLPPEQSAFAIHAQIVAHYLDGAWYPQGGAGRVARTFEAGIERAGGAVRVAQQVEQILVEGGRAVGVRVIDRRGASPRALVYRAPVVISDAGAPLTYEKLLPTDGPVGRLTAPQRALMATLQNGRHARLSTVTLYLRLRASAATLGVQGENHWINADFDHDDTEAMSRGLLQGRPRRLYLSFPSLKSGDELVPTAEIMSPVDAAAFDAWRGTSRGSRGADYLALKERIGDGMLALADTAVPGLRDLVAYAELSTPLTIEHYSMHPHGRIYGLPATPERQRSGLLEPRTPVPGLFLTGADAACLGIVGSLMGGVGAACQALGSGGYLRIRSALRGSRPVAAAATVATAAELPRGKAYAVLTGRRGLTDTILRVEFELDRAFGSFAPGQFARIRVADFDWRDYSIAALDGRRITFLISTRTGGPGSRFAAGAALGTRTVVEGPMGRFTLSDGPRRPVFVATGTGLAPFLPMFEQLSRAGTLAGATLYFGCRTRADDITSQAAALPGTVVLCLSKDTGEIRANEAEGAPPPRTFPGRVTDALATCDVDPEGTDFYICGSGAMVADTAALLARRGARHVFSELY
ncbi:MAG: FAD-dependent oxidoreductase [Pseudochelatococcus sp.]|jgi:all-trans-retinol 13,14-reductase|uniref:FAD-dependent oxidoreductase n=1 Tax=Pseudochelatococcus sp. TaxID=2020869 RepID=UPI003D94E9F0